MYVRRKDGRYRQVLDLAKRQELAGRTTLVSNAYVVYQRYSAGGPFVSLAILCVLRASAFAVGVASAEG
jgi:hypothetical protein